MKPRIRISQRGRVITISQATRRRIEEEGKRIAAYYAATPCETCRCPESVHANTGDMPCAKCGCKAMRYLEI